MRRAVVVAIYCALLPSCTLLDAARPTEPARTTAQPVEGNYLQAGPNTEVELGSGERSLLEEYALLNEAKLQLEARLAELESLNASLRKQLGQTEQDRDRLRNESAGSEQETARIASRARGLQSEVLNLNIEKAQLEQEVLRMRIDALQREYESVVATTIATPAAAAGEATPR